MFRKLQSVGWDSYRGDPTTFVFRQFLTDPRISPALVKGPETAEIMPKSCGNDNPGFVIHDSVDYHAQPVA